MAIIIEEEERRSVNWGAILTWGVLGIVFLLVIYYVFFVSPQSIDMALPSGVKNNQDVSKIEFNPDEIKNNPVFTSLTSRPMDLSSSTPGKINIFTPPQ